MEWGAQFDAYCERVDLTLWSEPVNAVTNLAFIVAALVMWRRSSGLRGAQVLCVILMAIGVGSALFHTFATGWAATMDVVPIGLFILTYLFLTHLRVLNLSVIPALAATALFLPYAALVVQVVGQIPFLRISGFYWTVPLLLVIYAAALRRRAPAVARGFVLGAAVLALSISLRSLDEILCPVWPLGTHFGWHLLNGLMLGWMIEVYRRHVLAGGRAGR